MTTSGSEPALFSPPRTLELKVADWRGLRAVALKLTSRQPMEFNLTEQSHLLVALEHARRYDGETMVEGLPKSTRRDITHKLTFIPAGCAFSGWMRPLEFAACHLVLHRSGHVDGRCRGGAPRRPIFVRACSSTTTAFGRQCSSSSPRLAALTRAAGSMPKRSAQCWRTRSSGTTMARRSCSGRAAGLQAGSKGESWNSSKSIWPTTFRSPPCQAWRN